MKKLKPLGEVIASPSAFDSINNYVGKTEFPNMFAVITRNRDSDILTESNFECALDLLGGESKNVEVMRFGHWACGYWEVIAVKGKTKAYKIACEIVEKIENYPVLDNDHFSEREQEEASQVWRDCYTKKDRLEYIRKNRNQFEFQTFGDLMGNIRGEYFSGYASELIN